MASDLSFRRTLRPRKPTHRHMPYPYPVEPGQQTSTMTRRKSSRRDSFETRLRHSIVLPPRALKRLVSDKDALRASSASRRTIWSSRTINPIGLIGWSPPPSPRLQPQGPDSDPIRTRKSLAGSCRSNSPVSLPPDEDIIFLIEPPSMTPKKRRRVASLRTFVVPFGRSSPRHRPKRSPGPSRLRKCQTAGEWDAKDEPPAGTAMRNDAAPEDYWEKEARACASALQDLIPESYWEGVERAATERLTQQEIPELCWSDEELADVGIFDDVPTEYPREPDYH